MTLFKLNIDDNPKYDLTAEFVDEPRKIVLNWLDNSTAEGNETRFHIQRSTRSDFREGTIRDIYVDRDETSYDDLSIPSSGVHTYWYRIRSCIDNYCSPFTGSVFASTDIPAPINLVASVVAVDEPNVIVSVSWRWPLDAFYPNQRYQIEWGELGGTLFSSTVEHEGDPSNAQSRFFDNLEFGKNYQFRIRTRVGQDSSDWTDFIFIDTEVFPVRGWAWANVGETGGTYHGIGWIRMSWDSPDGNGNTDDSGNKYGVFFDSEGKLSGYAWAGSSQGFGWLSFNEGDIRDCPIPGTCEAKIDFENEKFVGWARFISNYEGGGSWNGWVSLSNKRGELEREGGYGWRFEEEAKGEDAEKITVKVGGYAWGGDVTGWVLADFDIEVPFEWPILYDVITFTEGNDVKAAVVWENFKDYSRMQIRAKEYQEGDEDLSEKEIREFSRERVFEIRGGTMEDVSKRGCHGRFPANIEIPAQAQTRVQERLDNLPMHCTENQTEVILKDLEQGRKYHVFVRGWLVEEEKD